MNFTENTKEADLVIHLDEEKNDANMTMAVVINEHYLPNSTYFLSGHEENQKFLRKKNYRDTTVTELRDKQISNELMKTKLSDKSFDVNKNKNCEVIDLKNDLNELIRTFHNNISHSNSQEILEKQQQGSNIVNLNEDNENENPIKSQYEGSKKKVTNEQIQAAEQYQYQYVPSETAGLQEQIGNLTNEVKFISSEFEKYKEEKQISEENLVNMNQILIKLFGATMKLILKLDDTVTNKLTGKCEKCEMECGINVKHKDKVSHWSRQSGENENENENGIKDMRRNPIEDNPFCALQKMNTASTSQSTFLNPFSLAFPQGNSSIYANHPQHGYDFTSFPFLNRMTNSNDYEAVMQSTKEPWNNINQNNLIQTCLVKNNNNNFAHSRNAESFRYTSSLSSGGFSKHEPKYSNNTEELSPSEYKTNRQCFYCQEEGHKKINCPKWTKRQSKMGLKKVINNNLY